MALSHQVTARMLAMAAIAAGFAVAWRSTSTVPLRVLGQPSTAGKVQRGLEAPFFQDLAATTKTPLVVDYHTADEYGLIDSHQLDAIRDGRLDVISLRFMQNSEKEQILGGIDLPGANHDFKTARRASDAYSPALNRYLQQNYEARLLGIWSFGPQAMFCKNAISNLSDIRGLKVRVASPSLADVINALGGTAIILPFGESKRALSQGLVDCAVTSAASADFDDWGTHTKYYFPLTFQFGFNGYVISSRKYDALTPDQQQRLSEAFRLHIDKAWAYTEHWQREAEACLTEGPCLSHAPRKLRRVPVSSQDMTQLQQLSRSIAVPTWLELCERQQGKSCQDWMQLVAPLTTLGSPPANP